MERIWLRRMIVFIPLLSVISIYAQDEIMAGKVLDLKSNKFIEYAYIVNYSARIQTYSNSSGSFKIKAMEGDTLVVHALGYLYEKIVVSNEMLNNMAVIHLKEDMLELAEARIPVISSYDEFKREFVTLDRKADKYENLNSYLAGISKIEGKKAYEEAQARKKPGDIVIASVPILTPEEKERIKLSKIIAKEEIRDQVYQKFNPRVVKTITGLTNDDEIIEFMVFCKFSDSYILQVNEYDLSSRIALKYELFVQKKEDEKLMKKPINRLDYPVFPFEVS